MLDSSPFIVAISGILNRSPYFPLAFVHLHRIGLRIDGQRFIANFDHQQQKTRIVGPLAEGVWRPPMWVELEGAELLRFAHDGEPMSRLVITDPECGQVVYPELKRLVELCFTDVQRQPATPADRERVYGAFFSFADCFVYSQSEDPPPLRALCFHEGLPGKRVYVSSGFSDADAPVPVGVSPPAGSSGRGYELMLVCEESDAELFGGYFVSFLRYSHENGLDFGLKRWFPDVRGGIPGTVVRGFTVVQPVGWTLTSFPVGKGSAEWRLLLGITAKEDEFAAQHGLTALREKLIAAGYGDLTAADRPSVV
jgi:hypothetical protein